MEQLSSPPASTARMWRNYALGWTAYIVLLCVVLPLDKMSNGFTWRNTLYLVWTALQALVLALHWPLGGWLERRQASPALKALIHAVCAPVAGIACYALALRLYGLSKPWTEYISAVLYSMLSYTAIAAIFQTIRANDARRRQEASLQQAQALLVASELNALRSKLNPHFLFNTLHSIIALTRRDPDAAETALFQFSDMLRYVLDTEKTGNDRVTLDDELRFVRDYLELESLRLGPRLRVEWELDDAAGGHALPALSLQPLVENSIKHAFNPHSRPGRLVIRTRLDTAARMLTLTVRDDGPGADVAAVRASNGLGIRTVDRRLRLEYGAANGLAIQTVPGAGFAVTMAIPLAPLS
jgi:sensor histidine kinase YesM